MRSHDSRFYGKRFMLRLDKLTSDATTHHRTPDQNQSRQRAVLHTSVCTVLAYLDAAQEYTPLAPKFLPSRLPHSGMVLSS
jgi:hypothetical protein